jgi:hypothetical protein
VLLAIVLLDGQPARAQAESAPGTGYGQPLDSGVDLEGSNLDDNLDGSLSDPAPWTETQPETRTGTFEAAEDDAYQLLQDMDDEPLAPTVLAQRTADAPSGPDRTGGEPPASQRTDITPDLAQVTTREPQPRPDPARNQADSEGGDSEGGDSEGGDPQPTADGRTVVAATRTAASGDAEERIPVMQQERPVTITVMPVDLVETAWRELRPVVVNGEDIYRRFWDNNAGYQNVYKLPDMYRMTTDLPTGETTLRVSPSSVRHQGATWTPTWRLGQYRQSGRQWEYTDVGRGPDAQVVIPDRGDPDRGITPESWCATWSTMRPRRPAPPSEPGSRPSDTRTGT